MCAPSDQIKSYEQNARKRGLDNNKPRRHLFESAKTGKRSVKAC